MMMPSFDTVTESPHHPPSATLPLSLPAGGSDPDRFDWREAWYPIAYLDDLDRSRPTAFTLLERDLVIWWEPATQMWRVFEDQCPHRLAPLSEGRINAAGQLECPYHGWSFSGSGACQHIPQQVEGGTAHQSPRACVAALPAAVRQGMLFVYAGHPDRADRVPIPLVDPLEDEPERWVCLNTFRDLPYDALTLLENVLDPSHVPFTHHQSVGNRAYASPVELEIVSTDRQGFRGLWVDGPRRGTLGRQDTSFIAPNLMWHDLTSQQFGRTLTVVYATPIRKGECRVFARFPFKFSSKLPSWLIRLTPRWYSHIGQNGVLEDDQLFLHRQERYLAAQGLDPKNGVAQPNVAKAFYLPTKADRFVFEFRQWVNQYEADPFPGQALPPRWSQDALLDRYHSHTKHCQSCRTALRRIQQLQTGIAIGGGLLWLVWPGLLLSLGDIRLGSGGSLMAIAGVILAIGTGGLWLGLRQLERQFYEGRAHPPRNRPEAVSKKPRSLAAQP